MLVAIGFAVFLSGLAVAVSARGGGDTVVAVGAELSGGSVVGAVVGVTTTAVGLAISARGGGCPPLLCGAAVSIGAVVAVGAGLANGSVVGVFTNTTGDGLLVAPTVSPTSLDSDEEQPDRITTTITMTATTAANVTTPPITVETAIFNNCVAMVTTPVTTATAMATPPANMPMIAFDNCTPCGPRSPFTLSNYLKSPVFPVKTGTWRARETGLATSMVVLS